MISMNANMNELLLYFVPLFFSSACNNRASTDQNKHIKISFSVDKQLVDIGGNYQLFLVNGRDTLPAAVDKSYVELPKMDDSIYEVVFKYGQYTLTFQNIARQTLFPEQNMQWKFGVQNRPFDLESGLVTKQEYETDTLTRQLVYLQFDPQEHGDGIQIVRKLH